MKKLLKLWDELLPTGLVVLGSIAVSVGAAMIYLPAGVIAAGGLLMLGGVLLIRGGNEDI